MSEGENSDLKGLGVSIIIIMALMAIVPNVVFSLPA